jgi:hypothetical protein
MFFGEFFNAVKVAIIPQEDLAKSGYRPCMKHKKFNCLKIFWLDTETRYRNLEIFTLFFLTAGHSNPQKRLHL